VKRLEGIRIRHPLLRKLVDGSPVATKLTGQLSSRQIQEDAYIAWTPFREKQLTRYSEQGAAVTAANFCRSGANAWFTGFAVHLLGQREGAGLGETGI